MRFVVTTLIFAIIGVILALSVRIFCNKGSSANLSYPTCRLPSAAMIGVILALSVRIFRRSDPTPTCRLPSAAMN
ncbi:unnamed protein product [Rhodiola kirilowii]